MSPLRIVLIVLLLSGQMSFAQEKKIEVPSGVSHGVAAEAQTALAAMVEHYHSGTLSGQDVSRAAQALRSTFANWDESGFTAELQAYILAHEAKILEGPTAEEIHAVHRNSAVSVSEEEYSRAVLRTTRGDRFRFLEQVKSEGLKSFHQHLLAQLDGSARNMVQGFGNVFVQQVYWGCWADFLGVASLYFGIAAMAVAGPVGIAIGIFSIGLGIGSYLWPRSANNC
jgi:hypothetical protein